MQAGNTEAFRWEYFDERRVMWWPDSGADATHYANEERANVAASEFDLRQETEFALERGAVMPELVCFSEHQAPEDPFDPSAGEGWKDE